MIGGTLLTRHWRQEARAASAASGERGERGERQVRVASMKARTLESTLDDRTKARTIVVVVNWRLSFLVHNRRYAAAIRILEAHARAPMRISLSHCTPSGRWRLALAVFATTIALAVFITLGIGVYKRWHKPSM